MAKVVRHVKTVNIRYNLYVDDAHNIVEVAPGAEAPEGYKQFGYRVEKRRKVYEMPVEDFIAHAAVVE